jgi:hypothetical protein
MSFTPSIIATLATGPAIKDLRVMLKSLEIFNANPPTVYLYCDTSIASAIPSLAYRGVLVHKVCLDHYAGLSRQIMELTPGKKFRNQWFDFMTEKITLIRWIFETDPVASTAGVMFCDADICFMGPLPQIPVNTQVALSPHDIRLADEKRFGRYNGGFLWMSDSSFADIWWDSCKDARFYEQSALEDVADKADSLYEFPITENYGWWRLCQNVESPAVRASEWGINRMKGGSGITVRGEPLGSVHTHFFQKGDAATSYFNDLVKGFLKKLADSHPPAKRILAAL